MPLLHMVEWMGTQHCAPLAQLDRASDYDSILRSKWLIRFSHKKAAATEYQSMRVYTKLTREYENYLLRLNFGKEISLSGCIESAYRDFCRTLRGISKLKNKDELHANAV